MAGKGEGTHAVSAPLLVLMPHQPLHATKKLKFAFQLGSG